MLFVLGNIPDDRATHQHDAEYAHKTAVTDIQNTEILSTLIGATGRNQSATSFRQFHLLLCTRGSI